jgi:hypothetical protein
MEHRVLEVAGVDLLGGQMVDDADEVLRLNS